MRALRHLLGGLLAPLALASAAAEPLRVGAELAELTVGAQVYREVQVKQIGPSTVVFLHAEGLASVQLRDLAPEWQERFGYCAELERAHVEQREQARRDIEARRSLQRAAPARQGVGEALSSFERLLQQLNEPPVLRAEVDLRPEFYRLGVKDQGRRPSCSVFALVSALEYQNAALSGEAEKLSEEYLIWATRQVVQRPPVAMAGGHGGDAVWEEDLDAGFSLAEVVTALRVYGVPPQARMPNTFGIGMNGIAAPPLDVVEEARHRRRVYIHLLGARDRVGQIGAITHALNAGIPVVVGLRWPNDRTVRGGVLSEQKPVPNYAHAVTLVGYTSRGGRMEDTAFIFKNSYGARWGQGGYGRITHRYLQEHLLTAVVLEVQQPEPAKSG